ncbi:AMP-binding protein, partial [Streptomyces sp. NPDC005568]
MLHTLLGRATRGNGFYIGDIFHAAARRDASTSVILDHPPQWAPDSGTRFTVGELAEQTDELAARLWAAGVRPTERVALYKSENFDIALLACAVSRIGAVPALLSPSLDGPTAARLLLRLEQPWLLTDGDILAGQLRHIPLDGTVRRTLLSAGAAPRGHTG